MPFDNGQSFIQFMLEFQNHQCWLLHCKKKREARATRQLQQPEGLSLDADNNRVGRVLHLYGAQAPDNFIGRLNPHVYQLDCPVSGRIYRSASVPIICERGCF